MPLFALFRLQAVEGIQVFAPGLTFRSYYSPRQNIELRPYSHSLRLTAAGSASTKPGATCSLEASEPSTGEGVDHVAGEVGRGPEVLLWAALSLAPEDGISVPELISASQMSRPWIYQRLREMANRGQVTQVGRGRWRAVTEHPQ